MDFNGFLVRQRVFRSAEIKSLVDFKKHSGPSIYHAYKSVALFDTHEIDVAAGIGLMALDDAVGAGLPLSAVTPQLGKLVHAAVTDLSCDIENWRFSGSPKQAARFRDWFAKADGTARKRRIQELLGISERGHSRYLLLSASKELMAGNDIDEAFGPRKRPFTYVLDAFSYAEVLKSKIGGALFNLEGGEKQ